MPQVIDSRSSLDGTVKIFDSFYSTELIINSNEFDLVRSYFIGVCDEAQIADNFTTFFFRISQESGIPVMDFLEAIKGLDALNMNRVMAYYMNSYKSKTSMYGVSEIPQPNQNVARNIIQ
jgi:hypothetical protein